MCERPLVIKFGGTSVDGGAEFTRSAKIAAGAAKNRPVAVVVSAMSGTTDTLIGYARMTADTARTSTGATPEGSVAELHRTLADRHLRAAREAVAAEHRHALEGRLLELLGQLVSGIGDSAGGPAARQDALAVFGERLASEILAATITSLGTPAAVVEETPIATDGGFGEAAVDAERTRARCSSHVLPLLERGEVAVVPGYAGCAPCGSPTTLGRGGSDLSATALGRALGSREAWIMSDVDGVLDADPQLIPEAGLVPALSYREAAIFAGLGAKVLHPKTMEPAQAAGIEVRVRNTFNLGCGGTRIAGREAGAGVRCVALERRPRGEVCLKSPPRPPEAAGAEASEGRAPEDLAAVVCVGSPGEEELHRGRWALSRSGVQPFYAGFTEAGLVFVVSGTAGRRALRALHGALVRAGVFAEAVEGVA